MKIQFMVCIVKNMFYFPTLLPQIKGWFVNCAHNDSSQFLLTKDGANSHHSYRPQRKLSEIRKGRREKEKREKKEKKERRTRRKKKPSGKVKKKKTHWSIFPLSPPSLRRYFSFFFTLSFHLSIYLQLLPPTWSEALWHDPVVVKSSPGAAAVNPSCRN